VPGKCKTYMPEFRKEAARMVNVKSELRTKPIFFKAARVLRMEVPAGKRHRQAAGILRET
jgi:hypothetical protein